MAWVRNKSHEAGGFPLIDKNYRRSLTADWTELFEKQFKTYIIDFPLSISIFANPLDTSENIIHISQPALESELPELQKDALYLIATAFQSHPNNASILKDIDDIFWLKEKVTNVRNVIQKNNNNTEFKSIRLKNIVVLINYKLIETNY
ncbi:uncharacterized protein LOC111634758 [Centruroides sculpturatus]|uniref:uncharacterized protein LOC111634758 n=1 Tax=Centruroides sculpturatus TaxID=218467 RepID=UPI000C6EE01E|nr:uncharacterized protein LOC111634758 [Centruroides sculpturatus]